MSVLFIFLFFLFFYFFKKPFCRQKWLDTHLSERWDRNPTKVATFYGVWYYTKNSVYIIFSDPHQPIGHYYYLHWTDEKSKAQRTCIFLQGRWNFRTEQQGKGSFWGSSRVGFHSCVLASQWTGRLLWTSLSKGLNSLSGSRDTYR